MTLKIQIANRRQFQNKDLWDMHKLRAKVFKERMKWDIPVMGGMEIDGYDAIEPFYMLMHDPAGNLRGCWRILPTEGPYMLKDSFPELLYDMPAPKHPRIWELSRFAIETDGQQAFGFSEIAMESIREIIAYGHRTEVDQYVTVTTTAIERLLRRSGVATSRFGPPIRIGVEKTLGLYIDIEKSYKALFRY